MEIIRSVYTSNHDVIKNIMTLYNIDSFDLDCTYSTGNFYKKLPQPKIKSDLYPKSSDIIKANSCDLPFNDKTFKSVMFDPPFIIAGKKYKENKDGSSIISKRFEAYENFDQLKNHYYNTLTELYRVIDNDGILVFKCQDTVSSGKNHFNHVMIMNMAIDIGYYPIDMFILLSKNRLNSFGGKWKVQRHARKYHCYFWVFKKIKPKVSYNF